MKENNNWETEDLANYGHPISKLFVQPQTPEEWEPYILSKAAVDSFEKDGFLSGVKILTEKQVEV